MHPLQAMRDTVNLAAKRNMPIGTGNNPLGYDHIAGMLIKMQSGNFSYGKQCRWLGWAQCAVVASGLATLDEMKAINLLNKTEGDG